MLAAFSLSWEHNNVSFHILFPVSQVQNLVFSIQNSTSMICLLTELPLRDYEGDWATGQREMSRLASLETYISELNPRSNGGGEMGRCAEMKRLFGPDTTKLKRSRLLKRMCGFGCICRSHISLKDPPPLLPKQSFWPQLFLVISSTNNLGWATKAAWVSSQTWISP